MNIRYLDEYLRSMEDISVIGKNAEIDGVICNIMGFVRNGQQLHLLILEYDEEFQQHVEEYEEPYYDVTLKPGSNRELMNQKREHDASNPFWTTGKVSVGKSEFEITGAENCRMNIQNYEDVLLLSEFLRRGWHPEGIDFQNVDMLFLTSLELSGEYSSIPYFEKNAVLRFSMRRDIIPSLVEQPITLTVGSEHYDKLWLRDLDGKENWFMINRIYLLDMWEEMEKTLNNPKIREQMTREQIAQAKSDFEDKFLDICPKGMFYPVIEYECEENISLQFYTKEYLDAEPSNKSNSIGFIVKPENPTGILGQRLKAAIVQVPVPANTISIEAELFQCFYTITGEDIVLE